MYRVLNLEQNVNRNWANFDFKHPQNAVMQVSSHSNHAHNVLSRIYYKTRVKNNGFFEFPSLFFLKINMYRIEFSDSVLS